MHDSWSLWVAFISLLNANLFWSLLDWRTGTTRSTRFNLQFFHVLLKKYSGTKRKELHFAFFFLFFFSREKLTRFILLKEVYALSWSQNDENSNHCKLVFATATFSLKPIVKKRGEVVSSRCLGCSVAMVSGSQQIVVLQIWQKITKRLTCITFLCMIKHRNKTVAHTFLPSFDHANVRLCQERLLWSRKFAIMVTWRHTSSLYNDGYLVFPPKWRWFTRAHYWVLRKSRHCNRPCFRI